MTTAQDQLDYSFASQVGLTPQQVAQLRQEFKKFGRNPLDASLEILAIENSFDERKVKELFELYIAHVRRADGLPSAIKSVYD